MLRLLNRRMKHINHKFARPRTWMFVKSLALSEWKTLTPMSRLRSLAAGAVYEDKLYGTTKIISLLIILSICSSFWRLWPIRWIERRRGLRSQHWQVKCARLLITIEWTERLWSMKKTSNYLSSVGLHCLRWNTRVTELAQTSWMAWFMLWAGGECNTQEHKLNWKYYLLSVLFRKLLSVFLLDNSNRVIWALWKGTTQLRRHGPFLKTWRHQGM